ncbi:MAG TPA: YiiX family permuted papain-like enzyme [Holophagaceae bacterium]|nr:YiiX family permuted papain-like enzyme [Holophagaceae bacterium]
MPRGYPFLRTLLVPLLLAVQFACGSSVLPSVQEGDLIFQTSRSAQSQAIQQATGSPYSHMGIVLMKDGQPCVFEAIATVRYTPLAQWIERGQGRHYVVKRLAQASMVLTPPRLARLRSEAKRFEGRPYDLTFEWSDQRIYCSELVWKLYKVSTDLEVGKLEHLRDFNLDTPTVKAKLRERYGADIPLNESVISPKAMFESELLQTVLQR